MLDVLCGRIDGGINIAFPGRVKPVYGSEYYYFPAGTPVYGDIPKGFVHAPANLTTEDLYIINSGGDTKTLRKKMMVSMTTSAVLLWASIISAKHQGLIP